MNERSYVRIMSTKAKSAWLSLCLCLFLMSSAVSASLKVPAAIPIKLASQNSVDFTVAIQRNRNYYLNLAIKFDNDNKRNIIRKLVGDASNICLKVNDCGEETEFNVTIKDGDNIVLQRDRRVYGHYAFSSREYLRNILIVPLKPGLYSIKVDVSAVGQAIKAEEAEIQLITNPLEQDLVD